MPEKDISDDEQKDIYIHALEVVSSLVHEIITFAFEFFFLVLYSSQ